jgi:glycosyltransferase involved in cell wall biosynthesis
MIIVSNLRALPKSWETSTGQPGESRTASTVREFVTYGRARECVWLINCDPALTFRLTALSLFVPFLCRPVICVDLVLRRPKNRVVQMVKRLLLRRVAHFIHHFRDLRGYDAAFGIGSDRSSFVPFKPNLRYRYDVVPTPDGEYALCFGRSLRDFDTFFDAMERLPYPGAIAQPDVAQLRAHGSRFTRSLDQLPANVRLLEDDGTAESQIRMLSGARLVVLPVVNSGMVSSISVSLNAMLLGKCVVGSEGPGLSDIFAGMVITAPPEDPVALAASIRRAWEDDALRTRTAAAGHAYAASLGGEPELFQRIIDAVAAWRSTAALQEA